MDADGNDNTPEWGYCQAEKGCKEAAMPLYDIGTTYPNDPSMLLCPAHARSYGYCPECGCADTLNLDDDPEWMAGLCREHRNEAWSGYKDDLAISSYYHGGRG
jgi:hypothetical protein